MFIRNNEWEKPNEYQIPAQPSFRVVYEKRPLYKSYGGMIVYKPFYKMDFCEKMRN